MLDLDRIRNAPVKSEPYPYFFVEQAIRSDLAPKVAADFPELKIISAHPTWPWTAESLAIARHKANYYIDLSGWAPKYFPAELVHNVNTLLQDKAMFGSDWPAIGVERWLEEFQQVNMKPEVRKKIMLDNAKKFFGLEF